MKDEKISCPMFPRLHVNDKEKGGPRAPPRNKMALYEQLSIPSQRFNSSTVNSQVSSSEEQDMNMCFRFTGQQSNSSASIGPQKLPVARTNRGPHASHRAEKHRKLINKDDFVVPVFEADQAYSNLCNSPTDSLPGDDSTNTRVTNKSCFNKYGDSSASSKTKQLINKTIIDQRGDDSAKHKFGEGASIKIQDSSALVSGTGQTCTFENHNKSTHLAKTAQLKNDSSPTKFCKRRIHDDDVSEASTTDSASDIVLSTDDIVKVIGKENFWKARSMITKQQRMFMTQLFELHKLIKVQQMIAEDPDILLEETMNEQSETTIKQQEHSICEPPKKLPLASNIPSSMAAFPVHSEKPKEKSGPLSIRKSMENEASPQTENPAESSWAFPHPLGRQWLVPVMSPSEGLVYKPYTFPLCNGCGNVGSNAHHYGYGVIPCGAPYSAISPYGMIPSTSGSVVDQSNMNGSNDVSSRRSGTQAQVMKFGRSSETHLMASTASSSFQGEVGFFPVEGTQNHQSEQSAKVIKVVPRNRKSATVSAVRIFESIQEERKRNDGM